MITRRHHAAGIRSAAFYSDCGTYRYLLTRRWSDGPALIFLLLNPSTATEDCDDPTLARCRARARLWGYGAVTVCNLFSLRATDPRALGRAPDPVGPQTDRTLMDVADGGATILCGWGNHGLRLGRGRAVTDMLRNRGAGLFHIGLTLSGQPRHPLYVAMTASPQPWTGNSIQS